MARLFLLLLFLASICFDKGQAIVCYSRSGTVGNSSWSTISCGGSTQCYSYSTYDRHYAGCGGTCSSGGSSHILDCQLCSTDHCNSLTPSSISCHGRPGSSSDLITCAKGVSMCYTRFESGGYRGGCGDCRNLGSPSCVTCNATNYCNSMTPSSIRCYHSSRPINYYPNNGSVISCPTGYNTCYVYYPQLYQNRSQFVSGCGNCSADTIPSCKTCTSDYCNTVGTTALTCVGSYNCMTGINSCYTLRNPIIINSATSSSFAVPTSGCGVCTPTTTALYGCTSCNTSNCNTLTANPTTPLNPSNPWNPSNPTTPSNPSNPWNPSNPSNPSNPGGSSASSINCYSNFGQTQQTNLRRIHCPSSSSCFDYTFRYGLNRFYISGCGSCPFGGGSDDKTCHTCHSDYCNSARALKSISCYYSFGDSRQKKREVDCPSSNSCFEYSYKFGVTELYFAGCGNCTFDSASTNCRSCFTELCNSGSGLGTCGFSIVSAAALLMMLLSMR